MNSLTASRIDCLSWRVALSKDLSLSLSLKPKQVEAENLSLSIARMGWIRPMRVARWELNALHAVKKCSWVSTAPLEHSWQILELLSLWKKESQASSEDPTLIFLIVRADGKFRKSRRGSWYQSWRYKWSPREESNLRKSFSWVSLTCLMIFPLRPFWKFLIRIRSNFHPAPGISWIMFLVCSTKSLTRLLGTLGKLWEGIKSRFAFHDAFLLLNENTFQNPPLYLVFGWVHFWRICSIVFPLR